VKDVAMNRGLLFVLLCALAVPAHSMTATVSGSSPPAVGPAGSSKAADAGTRAVPSGASPDALPARSAAPNPATLTRPAAVLSSPDVPPKSAAAPLAKGAPARPRPSAILPPKVAAPAPAPGGWTATAAQGASMQRGTVQAISVGPGTMQVFGQKLAFNSQRVKVFNRDGRPGSIYGIKAGSKVRFTMDPTDAKHRRVAVIYVD
jgi:hypothetical protein